MNNITKIIRYFRSNSGLFYANGTNAKIGDIVCVDDDWFEYDSFGVIQNRNGNLVIDMGHKYFEITEDDKENINCGIERFYFYGIII